MADQNVNNWYVVSNINSIDSPALLVYEDELKRKHPPAEKYGER